MRFPNASWVVILLLVSPLLIAGQTRQFTRDDVQYVLELPSPEWRVISGLDVHDHPEFIYSNDPSSGYLRLTKILVDQPTSVAELFHNGQKRRLQHLPGYIVCSECDCVPFKGRLSGAFFAYEYVTAGRTMYGRIYYLQVDSRTFYALQFTVAREKLPTINEQIESIAGSFFVK